MLQGTYQLGHNRFEHIEMRWLGLAKWGNSFEYCIIAEHIRLGLFFSLHAEKCLHFTCL